MTVCISPQKEDDHLGKKESLINLLISWSVEQTMFRHGYLMQAKAFESLKKRLSFLIQNLRI